ncbi:MAG: hypothetical protein HKN03_11015, partial [Acidimicrobiales bacterium]|nr:hypothetical protein [Acidimicrobiales bacterium]
LGGAESALAIDELGTLTVQTPSALAGTPGLVLGSAALFTTLLIGAVLITDPLGTRVQSIGSMRAPEATQRVVGVGQRVSGAADRAIAKRDDEGGLDARLDAAGVNMRPGEFAVLSILIVVGGGLATLILASFWWAIGVSLAAAAGVWVFLAIKVSRRRKAFAAQLHSTISVLVGSMRAGRGLPQAIELVASEASAPTSEEFRRIVVESRVGRDPVVSMEMVAKRMDNEDLKWIAQAVAINRELGGDLTELLDKLAGVIRDRGRLKLQVRALSAEGRISAWVVGALPVLIFAYMHVANADYVSLLYRSSAGASMLIAGIILMIGGAIWMKKLVDVRF